MAKQDKKGNKGRIILTIFVILVIAGVAGGTSSSTISSSSPKEATILDDYTFDDAYSIKTRTEEDYCLLDYDTQTMLHFTKNFKKQRNLRIEKTQGTLDNGLYHARSGEDFSGSQVKYNPDNHKVEVLGNNGDVILSGSRHSVDSALSHVRSNYMNQIKK